MEAEQTDSQEKADLGDVRETIDEAITELKEEATPEDRIDPRFPALKRELKKLILDKANVSEEEYDSYVRSNPDKGNSKINIDEVADTLDRQREKGKNDALRTKELNSLSGKLKIYNAGFSEDELAEKADEVLSEAERVFGSRPSSKKDKYLKELLGETAKGLESELDERKESAEIEKSANSFFERVRQQDWYKKSKARIPKK